MSVITSDTVKDKLLLMESFNKSDISVSVKYTDGQTTTVSYSKLSVTGDDVNVNKDGTYNLRITYLDKTIDYSVRVYGIKSLTVSTVPPIEKGQEFNGQLTVTVVYEDNYKTATLNSEEYELLGSVNKDAAGTYPLTVKYKGQEAVVNVVVYEFLRLELSTNKDLINKGETWNGTVTVTAVYSNGTVTLRPEEYTLTGTVNGNVAGDHTLTVSYKGVTATINIHVKGVVGIEILNAPTFVNFASAFDKSNILIKVYYTKGEPTTIFLTDAGVSITSDIDSTNVNNNYYAPNYQTFSVSYEGKTASVTVQVRPIKLVMIVFGTFKSELFVGDEFDVTQTVISVVYMDGDTDPTNDLGYLVYYGALGFTATPVDTKTAGDKAYAVTYMYMTQTYPVHVKGVSSMTLSPGSLVTMVNKGKELDLTKIKLNVLFTNQLWTTVGFNDIQVVKNIDVNTEGKQDLIVSYRGYELTIEIEVVDKSATSSDLIFGVERPDSIIARDTYKKNHKDDNNAYVVGDDNKYYFYLELLKLDKNDNIVDVNGKNVESEVRVYLVENGVETLLEGAELAKYVAVNAKENSYDFVDGVATGKTFKLEIRPKENCVDPDNFWRSHTVTVVDAYNIYDAKELNLITNVNHNLAHLAQSELQRDQLTIVNAFLAENGITRPATMNGIVLHDNVDIKATDIPTEYYYGYKNKDGVWKEELFDQTAVYRHENTTANVPFTMYGNYYGIFSYNLPCVVAKEANVGNTDGLSGTALFQFKPAYSYWHVGEGNYNESAATVNVVDMSFRDNDPNSNDQSASERHMRGLVCLKPEMVTLNIINSNIHAFFVSTCPQGDYTTMNIIDSDLYNSWQGHIFVWSDNWERIQYQGGNPDAYPVESHRNVKINITNSRLAKCGGPVILAQTAQANNAHARSGVDVVVDSASELYSYVTGQEAWFVAINQTSLAGQIVAMNQLIQASLPSGVNASYVSDQKITGVKTINMIMVNMGAGMPTTGYADYEGSLTIGDKVVLNQNDFNKHASSFGRNPEGQPYYQGYDGTNAVLHEFGLAVSMGAPIFQSTGGSFMNGPMSVSPGTVFSDGANGVGQYYDEYGKPAGAPAEFFQGDYITLYFMGMGIALEYYH